jgi:hypothetical protein
MPPRWLCRLAVLATAVVVAMIPSARAQADGAEGEGTAELVGPLPVAAASFVDGTLGCTDWATGPNADQDLWRFRLATGRFVSIVLGFLDRDGVRIARTVEGIDGGAAWIATPAGWSLASGSAVVSGGAGGFELARACPAAGTKDPGSREPATGAREPGVGGLAPVVGGRTGTGAGPATVQGATTTPRSLAAGTDVGATVTVGAALVLAGMLLLIVRRHPRGRHRVRELR